MKSKLLTLLTFLVVLSIIAGAALTACSSDDKADEPERATGPEEGQETSQVVNRAGVVLPPDAAPLGDQVLRMAATENTWMTWDASVYDENVGDMIAWADSCTVPDRNYEPQPNACTSWTVSDDGLTWTFHLQEDKKWSDGTPITADDWVFTLQRYARPDYDFEWFYSMASIANWNETVSGDVPPEELGVKKVDDYTFTVTTDRPTPFLPKIFADVWVTPKHIVKDRLNDGTWAFNKDNWVFAGPYQLEAYNKGKEIILVANDMYTGLFPPMFDKIVYSFIEPEVRWTAYKNGELDAIGGGYSDDLPPSAMAEIMSNTKLKEQLITWPNFNTYYLFFDTWNPPFDNLKVRQAFSHVIDRDVLVEGPLKYQAVSAYSMNPPGFPGENIAGLKDVQNFDPELGAQLLEEAGYPGGEGFPKLTMNLRNADPAQLNAAEAIAAMIKEHLGINIEVQDLEYSIFTEGYRNQKKNQSGDFIFALVPYEYDFVDGSNLLSVWGGCEQEGADMPDMPGRHTWYNKKFNDLNCEAGAILNAEERRNELYRQAERILVEDVALVPIYHSIFVAMVKPDITGPMLEPDDDGNITWHRFRFTRREARVYRKAPD